MRSDRWQQHNITFPDRDTGRRAVTEHLAPVLLAAEADGQLSGWWFMNKQPGACDTSPTSRHRPC